jgi:predicted small secreted protein
MGRAELSDSCSSSLSSLHYWDDCNRTELATRRKGKMKTLKRMAICLLIAIVGQIVFTGCHTAHGFGEDMENAGQSIQDKSDQ